jgi:hypothetical protein
MSQRLIITGRVRTAIGRLLSRQKPPQAEESAEPSVRLMIEGVEVFACDEVPTGKLKFLAPGHEWNPTDRNILVCDLATFVSLAANQDSQRLAGIMVKDALRVLRARAVSEQRRARRKTKRAAHACQ